MEIEVQAAPDLSDHSKVGGVRLVFLDRATETGVFDLSPEEAHKLVEAILSALYQTGAMRGTI